MPTSAKYLICCKLNAFYFSMESMLQRIHIIYAYQHSIWLDYLWRITTNIILLYIRILQPSTAMLYMLFKTIDDFNSTELFIPKQSRIIRSSKSRQTPHRANSAKIVVFSFKSSLWFECKYYKYIWRLTVHRNSWN